jgi:hypothetical protein
VGLVIAILLLVGTLAAQPDPVVTCRIRASALTNTVIANTSAERRGGLANGDVMVVWKAKLSNSHIVGGSCEASPQTGRVVWLRTDEDSGDIKRAYRISPGEAERICQREARARFSPGNVLPDAVFLPRTSTKSMYRVGWQYGSMAGTIRKGRCDIDSATGRISKFDVSHGW